MSYASLSVRRLFSSTIRGSSDIFSISKANIFKFGSGDASKPVLENLDWTIKTGESWAVVGSSAKATVVELLTGQLRVSPPPPGGLYPFLGGRDIYEAVRLVSFATRLKASGGGFYDFTSRYGALRDEDKMTLRQSLAVSAGGRLELLAQALELDRLLDLPLVALSNGQTRRARILQALLSEPQVLVLDEPFTGLDTHHRPRLSSLLKGLHETSSPRVIVALRPQDPIPDWISHVLTISQNHRIHLGTHEGMQDNLERLRVAQAQKEGTGKVTVSTHADAKDVYVEMKDVNVSYHGRQVLKNLDWTIKAGDRWHLQGANGSGKTTLTSLLNGSHPQSYTQAHLHLFSKPRSDQPTVTLSRLIGHVSPELFNAFPRRIGPVGLTVREAIASGFDGTFVYRKRTKMEDERITDLVSSLTNGLIQTPMEEWLEMTFALLPPGEQSLTLLLRALVTRPKLLILDEVFSGMDERMVRKAMQYLRDEIGDDQAVVFIGHWESEVPWSPENGLKVLRLEDGKAAQISS